MPPVEAYLDDPQIKSLVQTGLLLLPRILPLVAMTPMLGGQLLPARLRIGLALLLVLVLLPGVAGSEPLELSAPRFMLLIVKEALVGLTLALIVQAMYQVFTAFGAIVDVARGATIANVLDPFTKQQQSILGGFFLQVAIALFLTLGGHRVVLDALGDSLIAIPLLEPAPERLLGPEAMTAMIGLVAHLFEIAVQLAAPALFVIILLDVVLGLLNRVAPQIQVYFLGLTVKSTLGLFVVLLALGVTFDLFRETFLSFLNQWLPLVTG